MADTQEQLEAEREQLFAAGKIAEKHAKIAEQNGYVQKSGNKITGGIAATLANIGKEINALAGRDEKGREDYLQNKAEFNEARKEDRKRN